MEPAHKNSQSRKEDSGFISGLLFIFICFFLISCAPGDNAEFLAEPPESEGQIQFLMGNTQAEGTASSTLSTQDLSDQAFSQSESQNQDMITGMAKIMVSLVDSDNVPVWEKRIIELIETNGRILSPALRLNTGEYGITEFAVLDENNELLGLTPQSGSEMAEFVLNPLISTVEVSQGNFTVKKMEVMSVEGRNMESFGYGAFNVEFVDIENFPIKVLAYVAESGTYVSSPAFISISRAEGGVIMDERQIVNETAYLEIAYTNTEEEIVIEIGRNGYSTVTKTIRLEELISSHQNDPMMVYLMPGEGTNGDQSVLTVVSGTLLKASGEPIVGAVVHVGKASATTDSEGFFTLSVSDFDKRKTIVKIEKEGYLPAIKTVPMEKNANRLVSLTMLKGDRKHFGATEGANNLSLDNDNIILDFPPNSLVTEDGAPYSGEVTIVGKYIDPKAENFGRIIPGNMSGIDAEGNEIGFISHGLANIKLEDQNGNPLRIAEGSPVEITLPYVEGGPDNIPLWNFDEELGIWVENGSAQKVGNVYVGKVYHFT